MDDDLYYTLSDHLGSTTLVADEQGGEIGYILSDPFGGIITNTLPATLSVKLLAHLDASTGLQYDGSRFYDPLVGGYVQPDSFGGVPSVPQSLNRYAAWSGGALIPTSAGGWTLPPLAVDIGASTSINTGKAALGNRLVGFTEAGARAIRLNGRVRVPKEVIRVQREIWENVPVNQTLDAALGIGYLGLNRLRGRIPSSVFNAAQGSLDAALMGNMRQVQRTVWETIVKHPSVDYRFTRPGRAAGWLLYSKYGKHALDLGFGMGIDVGYQAIVDYPLLTQGDITLGQYGGRLGVAATGSVASWGLGVGAGVLAATAGAPATVVGGTVFVVGVGINIAFDMYFAPAINDIAGFDPGTTPIWERIFD